NSAAVWVSIAPHADYVSTLAAIRALAAEYPGMSSRVGSYLSKKVRDGRAVEGEERGGDHRDRGGPRPGGQPRLQAWRHSTRYCLAGRRHHRGCPLRAAESVRCGGLGDARH